jgi:transcriptional regulator with XRE-family HTH domain
MNKQTIKTLLKREERSQAWLSRKLGVTPASMSYWLNGKVQPKESVLQRIADILGTKVKQITGESNEN